MEDARWAVIPVNNTSRAYIDLIILNSPDIKGRCKAYEWLEKQFEECKVEDGTALPACTVVARYLIDMDY